MLNVESFEGAIDVEIPGHQALPLWLRSTATAAYGQVVTIVARRGGRYVGLWHVPIANGHAKREHRLLPYAAPWLEGEHPQRRRQVMLAMIKCLQERTELIDLPLAPGFDEVTSCGEAGVEVAWRHTRQVQQGSDWRSSYCAKVRNQIRSASRAASMEISEGASAFDFDRGVISSAAERSKRADFMNALADVATVCCITASSAGTKVGQAALVADDGVVYLFHSWFCRGGPRGVSSLIIDAAIEHSFASFGAGVFDFEGSVLPRVDYFMSGFGGRISPYPHLRWRRGHPLSGWG
jgi:hypothetical protein